MIRAWVLLGAVAMGVVMYAYQFYNERDEQQLEQGHDGRPNRYVHEDLEYVVNPDGQESSSRLRNIQPPTSDQACPICQELIRSQTNGSRTLIARLPCSHWLHYACAMRLLEYHPSCPVCRSPFNSSIFPMHSSR